MKNPYPVNKFLQAIVNFVLFFVVRRYRIKAIITDEVKNINEPFLLIANHCGDYDPFIINYYLKKMSPNFIASEAVLRDKMGKILKKLGAMPKKKGVKDSAVIREMARVIQGGGAIGLFPEGARTWTGETLYIDPSLAKLIRLLNVPVITVSLQGAFSMDPRWGNGLRKTEKVEFVFDLLYKKGEARKMADDDIMKSVNEKLQFDFDTFQRKEMIKINSNKRAEFLDFVLHYCPKCKTDSGFNSHGNDANCRNCDFTFTVDEYGFLSSEDKEALPFDSIKTWIETQNKLFVTEFSKKLDTLPATEPLFTSTLMDISFSATMGERQPVGTGAITLFTDRLEFTLNEELLAFTFDQIDTLSPQFNERLEFLVNDGRAYRFESNELKEAGTKWELAMGVVNYKRGLNGKVAPYYMSVIQENCTVA